MSETILGLILPLLVLVLIGFVFLVVENRIMIRRSREQGSKATTTGDLTRLVNELNTASGEMDAILAEIVEVAQGRAEAAKKLQEEISRLEEAEEAYLVRIETLKNEPLRVINDLLNELQPNQIRTPRRDFLIFLAGGVVSAVAFVLFGLLR